MWVSVERLGEDIGRWRERGWITEEGERAIRAELIGARRGIGLPGVLAMLGAVLIGFAVMSFVAANWQEMSRLARLGVILGGLLASYAAAGALAARRLDAFAEAAVLAGSAIFGAGIMLIAQMYHIEGNPPDAVLTWGAGTFLAGVLLRSNASLALSSLLAGLWSGWEVTQTGAVHWPFLLAAAALAAAFWWQRWRPGLHLVGASVAAWVVALGHLLADGPWHGLVLVLGLAVAALGLYGDRLSDRLADLGPALAGYGFLIAYAALWALQFVERAATDEIILWGVVALALSIGAVALALASRNKGLVWLGYAGFSAEILALYFKTVGTLLGSSLFFLTAGIVVLVLATLAWRLHARQDQAMEMLS